MARYNPFFEHAAMQRIEAPSSPEERQYQGALEQLKKLGLDPALLRSRSHTLQHLKRLGERERQQLIDLTLRWFVRPKFRNYHLRGDINLEIRKRSPKL